MAMTVEQQRAIALARARRRRQTAAPEQAAPVAPPAPQERSWTDAIMDGAGYVGGVADQAMRGAATGMTNIFGLPNLVQQTGLSVLEAGLDYAGAPQSVQNAAAGFKNAINVFPSAEGMQGALDAGNRGLANTLGVEAPRAEPDNRVEQFVNRVGEEVGAAAVPIGAAINKARAVGTEGARALPYIQRMFVEPAAVNPGRFLRREVALAAGAGQGAAAANQIWDRDTTGGQVADFLGAVTGAGAMSAAQTITPRIGDIIAALSGNTKYASQVVNENVVDAITTNADFFAPQRGTDTPINTEDFIRAIEQPGAAETTIPGFQASTADRARDFGLANLENQRGKAQNAGMFNDRRAGNAQAVDDAVMAQAPTEQPGAFSSALETERGRRLTEAGVASTAARQRFEAAVDRLEPTMSGEGRGSVVREALEDAKTAAREIEREAYPNLDNVEADIAPLARSMNEYLDGLSRAEREVFVPPQANIPDEIVRTAMAGAGEEAVENMPVPTSMREVTGTRAVLNAKLREANAANNPDGARVIRGLLDQIDGFLDGALPADLRAQDARGRSVSRALNDTFTRQGTPTAAALRRGEVAGSYPTTNDTVAGRFVRSDEQNASALRDVRSTVGGFEATADRLPDVDAALQDQARAGMSRARNDPDRLDDYARRNSQVLDTYPELRADVTEASAAGRASAQATDAERTLQRDIGPGGTGNVARYLEYGDDRAEQAMNGVLSSNRPGEAANEILDFAGNQPRAVQGARRAFWNVLERRGRARNEATQTRNGADSWVPQKVRRFLNEPNVRSVAERLYRDDPQQLERVDEIMEALRGVNLQARAQATVNPSGTAQAARGRGVTMAEVQAKSVDVARGRLNKLYFVTYFAGKIANRAVSRQAEAAFGKLLDRALLEPEVAAQLLRDFNPANRAAMARASQAWAGNEAAGLLELLNEDDEDETNAAVMRPN